MDINAAIQHRRALHKIPELDRDLPKTTAYIMNVLSTLDCEVFSPAEGAICAYFDAGRAETVAFRADMDALPVAEENDFDFKSETEGCMHACGHDGHMAMLLTLAQYLGEADRGKLPRNALLIFQPAEETTGGAKPICESGVLKKYNVTRIFGFHLWPNLESGKIYAKSGPQMAKSSEISVHIVGKSVHISKYDEGADALYTGARFLHSVYEMEKNELPKGEPRLLKFGKMISGTVRNAVSAETELTGSMRAFSMDTFNYMKKRCGEIADELSKDSGCEITVHLSEGYPPVINDEKLYKRIVSELGADAPEVLNAPAMAAEDFAWYQQNVPGVFFFLGVGNSGELHSSKFHFDEEALKRGVEFDTKLLYLE